MFRIRHPLILAKRIDNLRTIAFPDVQAALGSGTVTNLANRLRSMTLRHGSSSAWNYLETALDKSYSGNELHQGNCNTSSSSWIDAPPPFASGADFCKAIKLRGNLLSSQGILSNPPERRFCRAGCHKTESLSHILQGCPLTHSSRIRRHDAIVSLCL